jgi:hypothetical protein
MNLVGSCGPGSVGARSSLKLDLKLKLHINADPNLNPDLTEKNLRPWRGRIHSSLMLIVRKRSVLFPTILSQKLILLQIERSFDEISSLESIELDNKTFLTIINTYH